MLVKYLRALLNPFSTKLDLERRQVITYSHLVGKKSGYVVEASPISGIASVKYAPASKEERAFTLAYGDKLGKDDNRAFRFKGSVPTATVEVEKGGYIYINAGDVIQSDDTLQVIWTPFKGRN